MTLFESWAKLHIPKIAKKFIWKSHHLIEKIKMLYTLFGFPDGAEVKVSVSNAGDLGSIPGLGRSPGEGNATYSSILAWRIPWTE